MSILSVNRKSTVKLIDQIEKELNQYNINKKAMIQTALKYSTAAEDLCITGEEPTCVKTTCYESTAEGSCPAGTIIKYKVNDTDIVTFHVMYDNGTTLTMQSQKNTISYVQWISETDYATENTDGTSCSYVACNDEGPMTVLVALERATKSWTNVNDQTYAMGTTIFAGDNAYTSCSSYNSCTTNTYTLDSRTAKARMITVQEAANLGCTRTNKSCPVWMYNYLYISTSYGGTVSDSTTDPATGSNNYGYWTMNVNSSNAWSDWGVSNRGRVDYEGASNTYYGARAVVVVSK